MHVHVHTRALESVPWLDPHGSWLEFTLSSDPGSATSTLNPGRSALHPLLRNVRWEIESRQRLLGSQCWAASRASAFGSSEASLPGFLLFFWAGPSFHTPHGSGGGEGASGVLCFLSKDRAELHRLVASGYMIHELTWGSTHIFHSPSSPLPASPR